jgi:hypothetical protein
VKIIGTQWDKTGEFIAIDGSNYIKGEGAKACPGQTLNSMAPMSVPRLCRVWFCKM